VKDIGGIKSATLLGAQATLRVSSAQNEVTIELPDVPATLMTQPAWVVKLVE
jgi:hypothetical protein